MDSGELRASAKQGEMPGDLDAHLRALWLDAAGDWDAAHELIQDVGGRDAAWIHAYLHRKEGDLPNAAYWYRRAGRDTSDLELDQEWAVIVDGLGASE